MCNSAWVAENTEAGHAHENSFLFVIQAREKEAFFFFAEHLGLSIEPWGEHDLFGFFCNQ